MASLVAVCRSDDYPFERRQIPLAVDDNLTMVMQFSDTCLGCNHGGIKQKELERFVQKFHALSKDEVAVALMVTSKDIFSMLSQMVPCLGCRRSVERLFNELVQTGYPALEPLIITKSSILSIRREYLFDPKAIYALFYVHGSKLNTVMESIPKSKKNKRCVLHSLDTHKTKSLGSWIDVWDVLSHDCREEVMLIDCESFMDTLDNYLRKHRFCSECKSKVQRAYNILVGEVVGNNEKGYCPALYEGLRCCPSEKHFHVMCDTPFIANIIGRAEPELTGSRRERHAKTLDIAQEEVLTCLGIHLYERLHRIWQKLRAEEQTWQLLFYLGVDALRKNFEVALEKKQGISNLELMCQELLEEEQAKEQRREQKRQKKKKKKNKSKQDIEQELPEKENDNCKWDENTNLNTTSCASCDDHNCNMLTTSSNQTSAPEPCDVLACDCGGDQQSSKDSGSSGSRSDCGYSSGLDSCELCSMPSSGDGSDVACSEPLCNHEGEGMLCNQIVLPEVCHVCLESSQSQRHSAKNSRKRGGGKCHDRGGGKCHGSVPTSVSNGLPARSSATLSMAPSLQDMLEDSYSSGEEESMISEEEIQKFKANQKSLNSQRQELREMLRQRFANLQKRGCLCAHGKPQQPCAPAHACIHLSHVSKHVGKLSLN